MVCLTRCKRVAERRIQKFFFWELERLFVTSICPPNPMILMIFDGYGVSQFLHFSWCDSFLPDIGWARQRPLEMRCVGCHPIEPLIPATRIGPLTLARMRGNSAPLKTTLPASSYAKVTRTYSGTLLARGDARPQKQKLASSASEEFRNTPRKWKVNFSHQYRNGFSHEKFCTYSQTTLERTHEG